MASFNNLNEYPASEPSRDPVLARFLAVAMLAAAILPSAAQTRQASADAVACHDYATRKYIADFRQTGPRQIAFDDQGLNIVMVFQNRNPRYEDYVADCMKRSDRDKAR